MPLFEIVCIRDRPSVLSSPATSTLGPSADYAPRPLLAPLLHVASSGVLLPQVGTKSADQDCLWLASILGTLQGYSALALS